VGKDLVTKRLHIWCLRHDRDSEPPIPNILFNNGFSFKVNLLLVVSGRGGCDYAEVLSGTQGVEPSWRDNAGMQLKMLQRNNQPYQASQ
jgi:hypothetical protein